MFCPKCATQNLDGASFCRTCGANISLVPQALTGQLTESREELEREPWRRGKRREKLSLELAFKNIFSGVAFLIISLALARTIGQFWWFWLLIPAFSLMGKGIAQFVRLKERDRQMNLGAPPFQSFPTEKPSPALRPGSPRATGEMMPPVPSVTEGTTRHLGVEAKTRQFDPTEQK
jgi:zinc ribbon protein